MLLGTLFIVLFFFEVMACIAGFLYFRKVRGSYMAVFPFYLLFVVCAELLGSYLGTHYNSRVNVNFYNFFEIPTEFLIFFWLFYSSSKKKKSKRLSVMCAVIYLLSLLIDILYFSKQEPYFFYSFSYTTGNILLLILILNFFVKLVNSDDVITFRRNMLFWISLGLLVFYLGSFPYYSLLFALYKYYPLLQASYRTIVYGLDSLMYLLFVCSFIWGKKPR